MADRTCTHDGCDEPRLARGLCGRHYRHARYHGTLPERPGPTTPHAAVTETAVRYGITVVDLIGPSREQPVVAARRAAAHALRGLGLSWSQIGTVLGGRDHTTAMNLARRPPPPPPDDPAPAPDGCHVDGCGRPPKHPTMAFCHAHDRRWRRRGTVDPDRPLRPIRADDAPVLELEVHDRTGYRNGCRCDDCRADAVRMVKLNRHRPQSVPVEQGAAAVRRLTDRGMTVAAVARASGVNRQTLDRWLHGQGIPRRPTVAKVLAVPVPCEGCDRPALAEGRWCLPCLRVEASKAVAS